MRRHATFALPGDPASLTGGYIYDAQIVDGLRRLGWTIDLLPLGDGFPFPSKSARRAATDALSLAVSRGPVIVDGLALGVLPKAAGEVASSTPLIALVHHPLALESGTPEEVAALLMDSERRSLAHATFVIATSATTAAILEREYGVAKARLLVARPGVRLRGDADLEKRQKGPLQLLSVAAISPRKGYTFLIEALAGLADLDWRLTIVGDTERNPEASARLRMAIERSGLAARVDLIGAVTDTVLDGLYRRADVFVLASLYEGYGMAYAEAIAHGLPVIGTTGGAISEVVPPSASILVEPGNAQALAAALRSVLTDEPARLAMSAAARAAAPLLPRWEQAVSVFASALDAVGKDMR